MKRATIVWGMRTVKMSLQIALWFEPPSIKQHHDHTMLRPAAQQADQIILSHFFNTLDRLLEEAWLRIDAISWTFAGPMNAVVLLSGHESAVRASALQGKINQSLLTRSFELICIVSLISI